MMGLHIWSLRKFVTQHSEIVGNDGVEFVIAPLLALFGLFGHSPPHNQDA
ncbi:hypothetical protein [Devosia sp. 1566]|nr:hypothetical protein [Devosia sp. 1566]